MTESSTMLLYPGVFAAMTALWSAVGHRLVHNRVLGEHVRKYGHLVLPVVLIVLGPWILSGARVLLG